MPTVSIITPLYNGADRIEECLASAQAQTFPDYEHLVIDNMSADGGSEIVQRAAEADTRIRLLSNSETQGAGPTRNVGIAAARGRYIAFLDCDDAWKPGKLERQITFMKTCGLAFSWSAYDIVAPDGTFLRTQGAATRATRRDVLTKRAIIGCLTAIYDRELVGRKLMCDLPMRQDFCLWLDVMEEAEKAGLPVGGLAEVLADYRVGGMTADKKKAAVAQWRVYREPMNMGRLASGMLFFGYATRSILERARPLPGRKRQGES